MLILTRKIGEVIMVNGDIKITVLDSDTSQVRIGIDAPRNVAVDREEIHLRKQKEFYSKGNENKPDHNKRHEKKSRTKAPID